jgi:hypothetical protein
MTTATTNPVPATAQHPEPAVAELLVLISAAPQDQLKVILAKLAEAFAAGSVIAAVPESAALEEDSPISVVLAPAASASWTLTAADFVSAWQLAQKHEARAVLMLGPEAASLSVSAMRDLAGAALVGSADLAMPHYDLPRLAGLVNSGILYPLTRSLFVTRARFPLAIDLGLSARMAQRMASIGQRFTSLNQGNVLLWPVNEAAAAGFSIEEISAGQRRLPQPATPDLNSLLALVTGSLFSDLEEKASLWQRARPLPKRNLYPPSSISDTPPDIVPMIEGFRLAYTNLREIWSLVLPPNSLLGLKRLSVSEPAEFRMPEGLWVRIVYDFLLAHRLRTINRNHLFGALVPLYLAWVASYVNATAESDSENYVETVANAFEADKAYLVSRWRWPDRFNP